MTEATGETTPSLAAAIAATQRWPSRLIRRGPDVRPLPPHARSLDSLTFQSGEARLSVDDYMTRCDVAGVVVLKGGQIALERYAAHTGPERRRTSYSTAKSITATLAGAAVHEGALDLDERCGAYLPRLAGSAYEGVTVRNVLRMCSGVAWNDVADGESDDGPLSRALARQRPGALLDLACSLPRAHPQGAVFSYSTVETCVLGAVVAAAVGRPLADYCGETIWGPAGMEADAYWVLEAEGGLELAGAGVGGRLRDFARFGQFVLEDGVTLDGRRLLPPGWRDLAGQPDSAATAFGALAPGDPGGYGYQWWVVPHLAGGVNNGAFSAVGAFGQYILVNPAQRVVIAVHSAWPGHRNDIAGLETVAFFRAVVRALQSDTAP